MKSNNISYLYYLGYYFLNDVYTITNSWYNKKSEKMILLFIAVHDLTNRNALMFNERDNPSTWNL